MDVTFISSVSVITPNATESRKLYGEALGLPLQPASPGDEYVFSEGVAGCKHFGVWPLDQAAQACFGTPAWPADRPIPQLSLEFDVASAEAVADAARELEARGYQLLHAAAPNPGAKRWRACKPSNGRLSGFPTRRGCTPRRKQRPIAYAS
jgi:hypothetical protein